MSAKSSIEWTDRIKLRFWSYVEVRGKDECWPWTGSKNSKGYGGMRLHRRLFMAHRMSLELKLGRPILNGFNACHSCDYPPCCNQDHLFEGTQADNIIDCRRKGRSYQRLTDAQVLELKCVFPLKAGQRGWLTRLSEEYGVTKQQISNIVYGRQRRGI